LIQASKDSNPRMLKSIVRKGSQREKELTDIEKKSNQEISRTMVKVEHAIGNCKVFRIVKE